MALSAKVGAFNTGTGAVSSTVAVTGVGFLPKIVILWWTGRTESTDTVGRLSHNRGMGAAVSSTERWASMSFGADAAAAGDGGRRDDNTACVGTIDTSGNATGLLDLQSMDSDGFTLIVDDVMPIDMRVHYLALAGADLTNVKASTFSWTTGIGNLQITGVGFQPDFLLFASAITSAAAMPNSGSDSSSWSVGMAVSSTQQGVWQGNNDDGSSNIDNDQYCFDGECISTVRFAGAADVLGRAALVTMDTDGFTINKIESDSTARNIMYVALKGGSYKVDSLLTQTNTTTDIVETGLGFQPVAALFMSHGLAKSTVDTTQAGNNISIGAFDSITSRGAQGMNDVDAVADTIIACAVEHDAVYVNIDNAATPTVEGLMDIKSVDADGFTCIMDDADPAQAFVFYAAFGSAVGGPILKSVEGVLSFAGSITKQTAKILVSTLSFTGSLAKQVSKVLTSALSFAGTLTGVKLILKSLDGAISFVGGLVTVFIPAPAVNAIIDSANDWIRRARTFFLGR